MVGTKSQKQTGGLVAGVMWMQWAPGQDVEQGTASSQASLGFP